jgi:dihydroflavonol-4-reductase
MHDPDVSEFDVARRSDHPRRQSALCKQHIVQRLEASFAHGWWRPMTGTVLLTGANGLIGSNICMDLVEHRCDVRALIRPGSELAWQPDAAVQVIAGDVTSAQDIERAAAGASAIIHSAAMLGSTCQDLDALIAVNELGTRYCYETAQRNEQRIVALSTTSFFSTDQPLTEWPEVLDEASCGDDPYTVTKGRAYREGSQRAAGGQDIVFVLPGATYGPAPALARAMDATSFNRTIRAAIRGRVAEFVSFPLPWVMARDVARVVVGALESGRSGATYLAFGAEDAQSTASFLNVACEVAGVEARVEEFVIDTDDETEIGRFGPSLVSAARRRWPVPWFENTETRETLGDVPTPQRQALAETLEWMSIEGLL